MFVSAKVMTATKVPQPQNEPWEAKLMGRCEERGEMEQNGRGGEGRGERSEEVGLGKQMLAQQRSMLATTPSLITVPPNPCPSVDPLLTFGPSRNLCPLSDHREAREGRRALPLWFFHHSSANHGLGKAFFNPSGFLLRFGPWLWSSLYAFPLISSGYNHRNSGCACAYVCVCVCVCSSNMMPASNSLECSSRSGSSWEGVTTSGAVGVSTCSENCSANVAAALFELEVCRCSALQEDFHCSCSDCGGKFLLIVYLC